MKTTQTITYGKTELTVLVEETEKGKAAVDYFLNGFQVTEWDKIKPVFQQLFTVISDDVCKNCGLVKWSY